MTAATIESTPIRVCESCEAEVDPDDEGPALYECGTCGTIFNRDASADGDSSRCPDCNKFSAKLGDASCPECGEGPLGEAEERFECPDCGQLHEAEDDARACCAEDAPGNEEDADEEAAAPAGKKARRGPRCFACREEAAGEAVMDPARAADYPRPEPSRCWAHQPRYAPVLRHAHSSFAVPNGTHWRWTDETYRTPLPIGAARHALRAMEDYRGNRGCLTHGAAWEPWVVLDGYEWDQRNKQPIRVAREWLSRAEEVREDA